MRQKDRFDTPCRYGEVSVLDSAAEFFRESVYIQGGGRCSIRREYSELISKRSGRHTNIYLIFMTGRREKKIESFNKTKPLSGCPQWPTSTMFAPTTIRHLNKLISHLVGEGRQPRRDEVLGALILTPNPPEISDMCEAMLRHRAATAKHGRRMLTVALPAPISLRLDGLVTALRPLEPRTFRRDVLGMLIWSRSGSPGLLGADLERYRDCLAQDVEFEAERDGDRLRVQRPPAGPRNPPL
jgi:hypothetical protein